MTQLFNEIDEDLKQDKFINFFKKYKFILIIVFSLTLILIFFSVIKNIIFESRAKKYTQEYVIILNLVNNKKVDDAKKKLEVLKNSKIGDLVNLEIDAIARYVERLNNFSSS